MSRQNIETIERACAAWGRGDISIYREMYAPDATAYAGSFAPEIPGELQGVDQIVEVLESLLATFDHSELLPGESRAEGDAVVVPILMRARPRGSSASIDWQLQVAYRFRQDGLIAFQGWYQTRNEALEAVGLRE